GEKPRAWVVGSTADRRAAASQAGAASEARTTKRPSCEDAGRTKTVAPALPAATCRGCVSRALHSRLRTQPKTQSWVGSKLRAYPRSDELSERSIRSVGVAGNLVARVRAAGGGRRARRVARRARHAASALGTLHLVARSARPAGDGTALGAGAA